MHEISNFFSPSSKCGPGTYLMKFCLIFVTFYQCCGSGSGRIRTILAGSSQSPPDQDQTYSLYFFQVGTNSPLWPECLTATLRTTRAHWAFFGTLKIATSRGASLRWLCAKKFAARTSFWATARFSLRWCAMPPRSRPAFSMTFTRLRLVEGTFYFYQ